MGNSNFAILLNIDTDQAKRGLTDFTGCVVKLDSAIKDGNKDFAKVDKLLRDNANTIVNVKKQYKELSKQVTNLTQAYNNMSSAEKKSADGKVLLEHIQALEEKAGKYRDTIDDVNAKIKHLASDTKIMDSVNAWTSVFGNALSIITAFGGETDKTREIIMKLAKIQVVIKAVNDLTVAFQKQNRILLLNPYAMAIAAIAALTYVLYDAMDATYQYKDAVDAASASASDFANNSLPSLIRQLKNKAQVENLTSEFNDLQKQLQENEKAQERLLNPQKFQFGNIKQAIQHWKDHGKSIDKLQSEHSELKKQ